MKHKRTKATAIPLSTKIIVTTRDQGRCIFCGREGKPEAHVVNRSQGGLGIPENIVTVCRDCHMEMDNGLDTASYREKALEYLRKFYPDWDKKKVIYRKYEL